MRTPHPSTDAGSANNEILTVVLAIFVDSWVFILMTAILKYGFNINSGFNTCSLALLICLVSYATTKIVSRSAQVKEFSLTWWIS
jgi:hypothetical protein